MGDIVRDRMRGCLFDREAPLSVFDLMADRVTGRRDPENWSRMIQNWSRMPMWYALISCVKMHFTARGGAIAENIRGPSHAIDDRACIRRHVIAAPADVSIRPHQDQPFLIERRDLRIAQ